MTDGLDPNAEVLDTDAAAGDAAEPIVAEVVEADAKTFSAEYVKQLRDEAAGHRKAKTEAEAKVKEYEDANLTAQEKATKDAQDATAKAEAAEANLRVKTLEYAVKLVATQVGIVDPDVALKLLDTSGLEYEADGTVKGVEEALRALVAAKPYLAGGVAGSLSPTNGASPRGLMTAKELGRLSQATIAKMDPDEVDQILAQSK